MKDHAAWLLLLHHLPPQPGYLRAKVMRRLNQIGAVSVKKAAYVLPANDDCREDFLWLLREIEEGGGEGWLFETQPLWGTSAGELEEAFRAVRARDYGELAEDARTLLDKTRRTHASEPTQLNRLASRLAATLYIQEVPSRHCVHCPQDSWA